MFNLKFESFSQIGKDLSDLGKDMEDLFAGLDKDFQKTIHQEIKTSLKSTTKKQVKIWEQNGKKITLIVEG